MKKDYKVVDEVKMTVTVSKDFLKKAGRFGTPEFIEALEMKKEGYTLVERKIKKNPDKQTYAELTYDKMKSVIEGYWTDAEVRKAKLDEFEYIKRWAKTQTAAYAKVKSWFKGEYGEIYEAVEAKASIVAIGSPIGITNTVSLGNISALYEADSVNWIQFTAPISSGSSGGALFDNSGSVIGVTSASYIDTQNLNLAVHISEVDKLYKGWNGIASSFEEYFLIANATPAPKPTPTPSPTPIPTTVPKPTPTPKIYKVLWLDDTGEEVKRLQQALIDLGYLSGKADGIFGKMTGEAVRLFNAQHGLSSDEFWGTLASSQTQQILFDGSPQKYEDLP